MSFQWVHSDSGVTGNESADALAAAASTAVLTDVLYKYTDVTLLILCREQYRHPHADVARGSPPSSVPLHRSTRSGGALLHRICDDRAFRNQVLKITSQSDTADCPFEE